MFLLTENFFVPNLLKNYWFLLRNDRFFGKQTILLNKRSIFEQTILLNEVFKWTDDFTQQLLNEKTITIILRTNNIIFQQTKNKQNEKELNVTISTRSSNTINIFILDTIIIFILDTIIIFILDIIIIIILASSSYYSGLGSIRIRTGPTSCTGLGTRSKYMPDPTYIGPVLAQPDFYSTRSIIGHYATSLEVEVKPVYHLEKGLSTAKSLLYDLFKQNINLFYKFETNLCSKKLFL